MLLTSVPLWITEIAPPHGRGVLASINGLMATFGYTLASYVGVGFYYYQNGSGQQWRAPLAFVCLPPLVTIGNIFFFKIPESPRWLLSKQKEEQAREIIEHLHRRSDHDNSHYAELEFLEMKKQIEMDRSLDSSWRILVIRPSYRKRALISCSLLVFLYSSGTLTVSSKSCSQRGFPSPTAA
jgi:MFS family permease